MKSQYTYYHRGSAIKFESNDRNDLYVKVTDYFKKNNITFSPDLLLKAIDRQSKKTPGSKPKKKKLYDVMMGAKAMLRYVFKEGASGSEIRRRASICESCPMRSSTSGCSACGAAAQATKLVNEIRVKKRIQDEIPASIKTKYCSICDCSLALMAVTKYKDFYQESSNKNALRPDHCWLKTTSENFTNE